MESGIPDFRIRKKQLKEFEIRLTIGIRNPKCRIHYRNPESGIRNPWHGTRIQDCISFLYTSRETYLVSCFIYLADGCTVRLSISNFFLLQYLLGSDRTNVCWVKEGCSSLKPKACSSLPLEVVDNVNEFNADKLNLHLNTGCYTGDTKNLQAQLNNAPASCNPPCFRIKKPGEYCYMSTRNNNFSNRRHMGQITVR